MPSMARVVASRGRSDVEPQRVAAAEAPHLVVAVLNWTEREEKNLISFY